MINITENAKKEIPEVLKKYSGMMLRVIFSGFGWGGPSLGLTLDEPNKEEIFRYDGIDILIDEQTKLNMQPSKIDCLMSDNNECQLFIRTQSGGCWSIIAFCN